MLKSQVERLKFIRNVDIIVGIDIAKETHWGRIISPYGLEFCKPFPINNNIIEFKECNYWYGANRFIWFSIN